MSSGEGPKYQVTMGVDSGQFDGFDGEGEVKGEGKDDAGRDEP